MQSAFEIARAETISQLERLLRTRAKYSSPYKNFARNPYTVFMLIC